ncbi:MAG TPA: hypothetical protein VNC78_02030 [Actinomycetota bacterium]|nr:hypothetical protein [Actinomycetota bacterium]
MQAWVKPAVFFVVGAVVALTSPALARTVADFARFARNSHRVDGFHAVGAEATPEDRRGRLVATGDSGYLPENIITRAPDASRLGGQLPPQYEESVCEVGVVTGRALVPASIGPAYEPTEGAAYQDAVGGPPPPQLPNRQCMVLEVKARHVATGVYHVDFSPNIMTECQAPKHEVVVTVKSQNPERPLIANTSTICDERVHTVEEVRIYDVSGALRDATFTIVLLTELPAMPLP